MREAIGSTFLFKIMIFFIFFFTAFLAIAINYSQAFRTKNAIINYIEQSEGLNDTSRERISNLVNDNGYYRDVPCNCSNAMCSGDTGKNLNGVHAKNLSGNEINGVCIKKYEVNSGSSNSSYYRVTTYVHFKFPIVGNLITIPVTGETKLIVNDIYNN